MSKEAQEFMKGYSTDNKDGVLSFEATGQLLQAYADQEPKKHTLEERKPKASSLIIFKLKGLKIPEVGIWDVLTTPDGDICEVYVPANDETEKPNNIEWWAPVPE